MIEKRSAAGTPFELPERRLATKPKLNRTADLPPNRTEVKEMNDLPELPFEKVLSYLSLEDRLMLKAVSRRWYHKINSFKVKSLCYSSRSLGFIFEKSRFVSGALAQNFISSSRFASFFDTYGQTILSSLKHLRLCHIDLTEGDQTAFISSLKSFGQLEELDIIRVKCDQRREFELNMPVLAIIRLDDLTRVKKLTLEAPRLREVTILDCPGLSVDIVHGESVERLLIDDWRSTQVMNLKNLLQLYKKGYSVVDSAFLSSLRQLKEIHLQAVNLRVTQQLFEQKEQSGRADLKIYLCGLLLNGPDDPAMNTFLFPSNYPRGRAFVCWAENPSRLADEIPFYSSLYYSDIESVATGLETDVLQRFTDMKEVTVNHPVQDIQRFLNLLKSLENVVELTFRFKSYRFQALFDRLPEHCAVQKLTIDYAPSDLAFLFRMKHLIDLSIDRAIDTKAIRRAFEELPVLSVFGFRYIEKWVTVEIVRPYQFRVKVNYSEDTVSDLNAAIQFIVGGKRPKKLEAH